MFSRLVSVHRQLFRHWIIFDQAVILYVEQRAMASPKGNASLAGDRSSPERPDLF
jgi:hypothetical protein